MIAFTSQRDYLADYLRRTKNGWKLCDESLDEDIQYEIAEWLVSIAWRAEFMGISITRNGEPTVHGGFYASADNTFDEMEILGEDGSVVKYLALIRPSHVSVLDKIYKDAQACAMKYLDTELQV